MDDRYYAFHRVHVFSIMTLVFALISLFMLFTDDVIPYSFIIATLFFAVMYVKARKTKAKFTEE